MSGNDSIIRYGKCSAHIYATTIATRVATDGTASHIKLGTRRNKYTCSTRAATGVNVCIIIFRTTNSATTHGAFSIMTETYATTLIGCVAGNTAAVHIKIAKQHIDTATVRTIACTSCGVPDNVTAIHVKGTGVLRYIHTAAGVLITTLLVTVSDFTITRAITEGESIPFSDCDDIFIRLHCNVIAVQAEYHAVCGRPFFVQRYWSSQIIVTVCRRISQSAFITDSSPCLACRQLETVAADMLALYRHKFVQSLADILIAGHVKPCCLLLSQYSYSLVNGCKLCADSFRVLRRHLVRQGVNEFLHRLGRRILFCILCAGVSTADVSATDTTCGVNPSGTLAALHFLLCRYTCSLCQYYGWLHRETESKCHEQTQYSFLHRPETSSFEYMNTCQNSQSRLAKTHEPALTCSNAC